MQWRENFQTVLNNINKCEVCFSQYNLTKKSIVIPLFIFQMHHTICQQCLLKIEDKKCPFCRQIIDFDKIAVNRYLSQLTPVQLQLPEQQEENQDQSNEIKIPSLTPRRIILLYIVYMINLVHMALNVYFFLVGADSHCYDEDDAGFVLRRWLLAFTIIYALNVLFGLVQYHVCRYQIYPSCSKQTRSTFMDPTFLFGLITIWSWAFMEILLFALVIAPFCKDGIYVYGAIEFAVNLILLFLTCTLCFTQAVFFQPKPK